MLLYLAWNYMLIGTASIIDQGIILSLSAWFFFLSCVGAECTCGLNVSLPGLELGTVYTFVIIWALH